MGEQCFKKFPFSIRNNPDSKWKLGQRWSLGCNFCWANVGCAMQKPSALCSSKKRWPNMLYKRWPNMVYKRWPNMLYKRWPNMLYKRWPNMLGKRWFSVSKWKLLTMFFLIFIFSIVHMLFSM